MFDVLKTDNDSFVVLDYATGRLLEVSGEGMEHHLRAMGISDDALAALLYTLGD